MKIPANILPILGAVTIEGNVVKLTGQLDRPTYEAVNKVLVALGGKWTRKTGHVFADRDPEDAIQQALASGEVSTAQDMGFFPTPEEVIRRMFHLLPSVAGKTVLEPSAGTGALVNAALGLGAYVDPIELDPTRWAGLNDQYLSREEPRLGEPKRADFLSVCPPRDPGGEYDFVIMNPPFGKQADIPHVRHALRFLKPGGELVSVMSAGVLFRSDKKTTDFRALIERLNGTIQRVPEGAFRESGTMVNTCIVWVKCPPRPTEPVHLVDYARERGLIISE